MSAPAGIPEADWLETPASVRALINAQQQEIELLRGQLTSLGTPEKAKSIAAQLVSAIKTR
jgi:hypothetical protein